MAHQGAYHSKPIAENDDFGTWHSGATRLVNFARTRVLDIGCGTGAFLERIRPMADAVLGIDPNPRNVELVKSKNLPALAGYFGEDSVRGAVDRLAPNVITCFEVIEHIYTPRGIFRNAYETLKRHGGGTFIVSTPNAFHLLRTFDFVMRQSLRDPLLDPTRSEEPEHIRLYSYSMLERGLRDAGFGHVKGHGVALLKGKLLVPSLSPLVKHLSQNLLFVATVGVQ
jgi:SAM-dependent methyltransferase